LCQSNADAMWFVGFSSQHCWGPPAV
jgi:hypothetical protein